MDIREALKEQYHGGLAMLAQCVERCPDELWTVPAAGPERPFWRIAFHAAFFTHLYLGQGVTTFQPPTEIGVAQRQEFGRMWSVPAEIEPYELPLETEACSRSEMLEYISFIDALVDPTIDGLDLENEESGFPWYRRISKLSHQMMNLRHVQGHIGQLSELLMMRGIDTEWKAKASALRDDAKSA